jgi:hypothetical protein
MVPLAYTNTKVGMQVVVWPNTLANTVLIVIKLIQEIDMTTIQEINSAIMSGTWTDAELSSMISAVRFNRAQLVNRVKRSIMLGDSVKFHSTKRGMTITGNVQKVAIKYVTVQTPQGGLWKVPANMLEVV